MPTERSAEKECTEYRCKRCGSSLDWEECWNCGGEGVAGHNCGEDCCCCADPVDNIGCDICQGRGAFPRCLSSPKWCEANPRSGMESVPRSTPEKFTYKRNIFRRPHQGV